MHYKKFWLAIGIIYITIILLGSLAKIPDYNIPLNHSDKIIHFFIYFILVGWFVQLYEKNKIRLLILCLAIFLGMFIEMLQGMTDYRSFDYYDILANAVGAICAFSLSKTSFSSILRIVDIWITVKLNKKT